MPADATRAVLQAYAAAWRAGEVETLLATYADDVVFHYFGSTDLAGTHRGKSAAVAAMIDASTRCSRELVEIVDLLVGESLGALVVTERLTRGDLAAEVRRTAQYRIEDGRIHECWILDEDQALIDRFWAPQDPSS